MAVTRYVVYSTTTNIVSNAVVWNGDLSVWINVSGEALLADPTGLYTIGSTIPASALPSAPAQETTS